MCCVYYCGVILIVFCQSFPLSQYNIVQIHAPSRIQRRIQVKFRNEMMILVCHIGIMAIVLSRLSSNCYAILVNVIMSERRHSKSKYDTNGILAIETQSKKCKSTDEERVSYFYLAFFFSIQFNLIPVTISFVIVGLDFSDACTMFSMCVT